METKEAKVRLAIDGQSVHAEMVKAQEDLTKVRAEAVTVGRKVRGLNMEITGVNDMLRLKKKEAS